MASYNSNAVTQWHEQRMPVIIIRGIRILTSFALASFVLVGFWSAVQYGEPEIQLLVGFLVLTVLLSAAFGILQKRYRSELLVSVLGLLIMVGNPLLRLLYGYDSFEGHWYFAPVQIEYITYAAVALVFSRRVHWSLGILAPAIIYALDNILTQSFWWWGYALIAIMCGVVGTVLGFMFKRINTPIIEEATLASVLLAILVLMFFYQMGRFY